MKYRPFAYGCFLAYLAKLIACAPMVTEVGSNAAGGATTVGASTGSPTIVHTNVGGATQVAANAGGASLGGATQVAANSCDSTQTSTRIVDAEDNYVNCRGTACDFKLKITTTTQQDGCDLTELSVLSDTSEVQYVNRGSLTPVGHQRSRSLALALLSSGQPALANYGCVACNYDVDTSITLTLDGTLYAYSYYIGQPQPELIDINTFAQTIVDALRTCVSSEYIAVTPGNCTPST
jgi:hypothetical protein